MDLSAVSCSCELITCVWPCYAATHNPLQTNINKQKSISHCPVTSMRLAQITHQPLLLHAPADSTVLAQCSVCPWVKSSVEVNVVGFSSVPSVYCLWVFISSPLRLQSVKYRAKGPVGSAGVLPHASYLNNHLKEASHAWRVIPLYFWNGIFQMMQWKPADLKAEVTVDFRGGSTPSV